MGKNGHKLTLLILEVKQQQFMRSVVITTTFSNYSLSILLQTSELSWQRRLSGCKALCLLSKLTHSQCQLPLRFETLFSKIFPCSLFSKIALIILIILLHSLVCCGDQLV